MKLFNKQITRYLLDEIDPVQQQELEKQIEKDESLSDEVTKFKQLLAMKSKQVNITAVDTKWDHLRQEIRNSEHKKSVQKAQTGKAEFLDIRHRSASRLQLVFSYAAVLILAIAVVYFSEVHSRLFPSDETTLEYKVVKVGKQERFSVSLSDGSTITLDAGSQLKYPTEFADRREVYLSGEAYFEVTQNMEKPFQVHTGNALVTVMGTRFNIRNWADSYEVVVTVDEGKVLFESENKKASEKVILLKNQQSIISGDGHPSNPKIVDASIYTLWMNNEIHFENATVREVLAQLARWYDFKFELDDSSIMEQALTIHIQKATVDDVFELIALVTETDVLRDGKKIKFIKK